MGIDEKQRSLLKMLPGVDHVLELAGKDNYFTNIPKSVLVLSIRLVVEALRTSILEGNEEITATSLSDHLIIEKVKQSVKSAMKPNLKRTSNGTGVVVHTNLGRSLLTSSAVEHLCEVSTRYSNLEFDLRTGKRGLRYSCVEDILCELTGAEAAMVVNNNAGAVLLCLETLAKGKEAIVSRGELVEIGGSFRIPDVMARSGAILKEVGTTNRTHLSDYENAINNDTGLLLKVHTSNYSIVGFTASVSVNDMVALALKHDIPFMEDLGSGTLIDFSKYGLSKEPTVQESVTSGADVVTFSGDKLLGGPQAGIIVGKKDILDKIKKNPITRALRIDKLTLAALESTLRLYRDEEKAIQAIPTLRMLTLPFVYIEEKAKQLAKMLEDLNDSRLCIRLLNLSSRAGGGALPIMDLPTKGIGCSVKGISANAIERSMRENMPPVIGRIEEGFFIMDLRTIQEDELEIIKNAFDKMLKKAR
jgi:L-seryl-tRNA(Ser) seleniumtransferase